MHRVHVREQALERLLLAHAPRPRPSPLKRRLRRLRSQVTALERRLVAAEIRALEAEDRARAAEALLAAVPAPLEPVQVRSAPSPARILLPTPWWRRVGLRFLAR